MEVFGTGKLGRGVALEAQHGVVGGHAAAVVYHLDKRTAGVCHGNLYVRGAGVYRILHEFLHHRGRSLDHLPGSYHVRDILW